MSQLPPAHPAPQGTPAADAPVTAPGFELALQEFWVRNRRFIFVLIAAALLVIIGREGWAYFANAREKDLQSAYAKLGDSTDRLVAFADAHSGHTLAGVAYLRAADAKFEAGDFKTARTYYTKAAGSIKQDVLLGRARLGAAVCQLNSGDQAGGEAALRGLNADAALFKSTRAEATYHLASLAAGAGRAEEVRNLADQINLIEPNGPWAQRATMLVASQPAGASVAAAPAAAAETPSVGISFKPTVPEKPPGK